jgi:cytochrome P450
MSATGALPPAEAIAMPMARERVFDPPSALARLRERQPLCRLRYRGGEVGWLITSHALARAVLTDPRFSLGSKRPFPVEDPVKQAAVMQTLDRERANVGNLLAMDPPDHTRLRRLLAGQFSSDRMSDLRGRIEHVVNGRLAAMQRAGPPADLVQAFAAPVALEAHCALLGVPATDSDQLERISTVDSDPRASADDVTAAIADFRSYLEGVVARKRRQPADDLMSHIVSSQELTSDEILSVLFLLFTAGVDTVAAMLATGPFALLCHPGEIEGLRADPASIDVAVEELMRYLTIFQVGALTRTALEDITLGDLVIRAGESVTVSLAAANRDPAKFENPDVLDLSRSARGHLGFGHGVHVCLGQHLARLEMQVGIGQLLRRLPSLRLAVPPEAVPLSSEEHLIFGVRELPVTWTAG